MGKSLFPQRPAATTVHGGLGDASYESLPNYTASASGSGNVENEENDPLFGNSSADSKFNNAPIYQDKWATVAFFAHLVVLAFLTVAGWKVNLPDVPADGSDPRTPGDGNALETADPSEPQVPIGDFPALSQFAMSFFGVILAGFLLTVSYFFLMERYPRQLIHSSFIFNTVTAAMLGIFYLASGAFFPALFALIYSAIHIFMYFAYRTRMEFARVILTAVTTVTKSYPGTLAVGVAGTVVQTIWMAVWTFAAIGGYRLTKTNDSDAVKYIVSTYIIFSMYWTSQVIKNVVHVTVSGLFATYYFTGISTADGSVVVPVANPTLKSAKRAVTTSFGPIAFGSLIIALIQTLRHVANQIRRNAQEDNNSALALVATCADCLLSMIEGVIAFINVYAFTQVAIYGKSYLEAGRDTWALLQSRGVDLIINDDLTSGVLTLGGVLIAFLAGTVGYIIGWLQYSEPAVVWVLAGLGFVAGIIQFWVLSETIRSGVATTFVCLAEDPLALRRTKPELYNKFSEVYPRSVQDPAFEV
ncbi:plasma-membrane choline transporter-domain-containing protein [Fimicolochytrium jonesii]|uniref:plasma-membrane choline transporter-domain-containing protein n=1 Tax=Fimicolochytrium jonesii TaxID=1396493 RepID=UPI0022FDFF47|nr:plasma-membrane choline transporter-domain-containing protein [Fimicolochytrium jonesii]KAI8824184.1 plasma-membrane choline transporter-domain-containing protein [Fimicolochytrium jonesii]